MPLVQIYRFLFFIALLYSFYMFFSTDVSTGLDIPHIDKLGHFVAFSGLSFLFDFAFAASNKLLLILSLGYGIFVELVQTQIDGRSGSIADLVADLLGTICYLWFGRKLAHKLFPVPSQKGIANE